MICGSIVNWFQAKTGKCRSERGDCWQKSRKLSGCGDQHGNKNLRGLAAQSECKRNYWAGARSIFMKTLLLAATEAAICVCPVIVFAAAADSISLFHHRRIRLSSHIIIARDNKVHYQCQSRPSHQASVQSAILFTLSRARTAICA